MAGEEAEDDAEAIRIGSQLERALAEKGVSVAEAATTAGCSTNTLRRMFKGRGLDLVRVFRLERTYGFSLAGGVPMVGPGSPPGQDVVDVPVLTSLASAGSGSVLGQATEERGTVPVPRQWLRRFGTPSRLRMVEIVGNSMSPDLEEGDWMLVNLDRIEVREGVALVRYDDTMLVKRLQPQGRQLLLTSSNAAYKPIELDLAKDADRFAIIGFGEGRWRARRLA